MALDDMAVLEGLGKVSVSRGRTKKNHVVNIEISEGNKSDVLGEISKYLARQKDIRVDSVGYHREKGKVKIRYTDLKEEPSKPRGSTGCGSSLFPSYSAR